MDQEQTTTHNGTISAATAALADPIAARRSAPVRTI
jgi:hypothetical protein